MQVCNQQLCSERVSRDIVEEIKIAYFDSQGYFWLSINTQESYKDGEVFGENQYMLFNNAVYKETNIHLIRYIWDE